MCINHKTGTGHHGEHAAPELLYAAQVLRPRSERHHAAVKMPDVIGEAFALKPLWNEVTCVPPHSFQKWFSRFDHNPFTKTFQVYLHLYFDVEKCCLNAIRSQKANFDASCKDCTKNCLKQCLVFHSGKCDFLCITCPMPMHARARARQSALIFYWNYFFAKKEKIEEQRLH